MNAGEMMERTQELWEYPGHLFLEKRLSSEAPVVYKSRVFVIQVSRVLI